MIWHVLRKDLRILWPMAVLVALSQFLAAALLSSPGQFARGVAGYSPYGWLTNNALPAICLLGLVILSVAVVQQDRWPGATQDWLTRPIPRGRLLLAKMLFILTVGLGPVLVSDIASGLLEQLPLPQVIAASLTRTLVLSAAVCLPAVLIGVVTRSLTEALVFALAVIVLLGIETAVLAQISVEAPLLGSGFGWSIFLALLLMNAVAAVVALRLQLRWRGTNRVRWIVAGYLCAAPAIMYLPWAAGFGLQTLLTGTGSQPDFSVVADSTRKVTFTAQNLSGLVVDRRPAQLNVFMPVSLAGSAVDRAWEVDYADLQLIDSAGHSLGSARGSLSGGAGSRRVHAQDLVAMFPALVFREAQRRGAVVRATLYLTTFRLAASGPVARLSHGSIDAFSRCSLGYGEVMRCVSTRAVGTCTSITDPTASGRAPLAAFTCREKTYAPWPLPLWRDPYYTYLALGLSRAPQMARHPELESLELLNYVADAHFVQRLEFAVSDAAERPAGREPRTRDGAGTAARFAGPAGIVADSHGNVFIVDQVDSVVRKLAPSGEVTTLAGQAGKSGRVDGQGSDALFNQPSGIAVDAHDNLYVADTGNALVRRISPTGLVTTVAGESSAAGTARSELRLVHPTGVVCARDGALYVIDRAGAGSTVLQVLPDGSLKPIAGPDPRSATDDPRASPQTTVEQVSE